MRHIGQRTIYHMVAFFVLNDML